jgi:insertion element IS1 protein InsB
MTKIAFWVLQQISEKFICFHMVMCKKCHQRRNSCLIFYGLRERLKRWKVEIYCADHWDVYPSEIPLEKLVQGKAHTVLIERNNGRQRHWFARFRRKSIVASRSLHMVNLTMALFARFHVNGNREDIKTLFA